MIFEMHHSGCAARDIAARFGRHYSKIHAVLTGCTYADVCPEIRRVRSISGIPPMTTGEVRTVFEAFHAGDALPDIARKVGRAVPHVRRILTGVQHAHVCPEFERVQSAGELRRTTVRRRDHERRLRRALRMIAAGHTVSAAARATRIGRATLYHRRDLPPQRRRSAHLSVEQKARIRELFALGIARADIARAVGCALSTVYRIASAKARLPSNPAARG